jgi:protein TonB
MEQISALIDDCAEIVAIRDGCDGEATDSPDIVVSTEKQASNQFAWLWSHAWMASLFVHAGTAYAALYWISDYQPELLSIQRGVAAIELVASVEMVEQVLESDEQPLELKPEPVQSEPLQPTVETPRTTQTVELRPLEKTNNPTELAPPPPPVRPSPPTEELVTKTSPPPAPKRAPRPIEIPVEVVQVDSIATPMSQATEGIETPDELPRQVATNRPPSYPVEALAANVEGVVTVRATIDAAGIVADVELSQSSGTASLDLAALNAVRNWRFAPARKAGLAIKTVVLVPVRFSIRRNS